MRKRVANFVPIVKSERVACAAERGRCSSVTWRSEWLVQQGRNERNKRVSNRGRSDGVALDLCVDFAQDVCWNPSSVADLVGVIRVIANKGLFAHSSVRANVWVVQVSV